MRKMRFENAAPRGAAPRAPRAVEQTRTRSTLIVVFGAARDPIVRVFRTSTSFDVVQDDIKRRPSRKNTYNGVPGGRPGRL